jgi:hypothetical protein
MIEETENPILSFLGRRARAVGSAFRTNPRYRTRHRANLVWPDMPKVRKNRVRLIDISRAGAALSTSSPPPVSTVVRLRLVGAESTPWIEGVVLGVERLDDKQCRVRVLFRDPCPSFFLKIAILDGSSPYGEPAPTNADEMVEGD